MNLLSSAGKRIRLLPDCAVEATPATESIQMLDYLRRNKISLEAPDFGAVGKTSLCEQEESDSHSTSDSPPQEPHCQQIPLIVSMTSAGDSATGIALPLGQTLARITHSTHRYHCDNEHETDDDCRAGFPKQSTLYTELSLANIRNVQNGAPLFRALELTHWGLDFEEP